MLSEYQLFFKRKKDQEKVIYHHADDAFGEVQVTDKGSVRYLKFGNFIKQGGIDRKKPEKIYLKYQQAMLSVFDGRSFERCLCLGLGAGTIPGYIHRNRLCRSVEVVELNPTVIEVARRFFGFPEEVVVYNADAQDYAVCTTDHYDLIFVDIFNKEGTPSKFKAPLFYQRLHRLLSADGVAVFNIWSSDFNNLLLQEMLVKVFSTVRIVKAPGSTNHIAICNRVR